MRRRALATADAGGHEGLQRGVAASRADRKPDEYPCDGFLSWRSETARRLSPSATRKINAQPGHREIAGARLVAERTLRRGCAFDSVERDSRGPATARNSLSRLAGSPAESHGAFRREDR